MAADLGHLVIPEGDLVATVSGADYVSHVVGLQPGRLDRGLERTLRGPHDVRAGVDQRASHDPALLIHEDRLRLSGSHVHASDYHRRVSSLSCDPPPVAVGTSM